MDNANIKYLELFFILYVISAENSTNNPKNAEKINNESGANNKSNTVFSGIKKNGFISQLNEIIYEISESQNILLNACFPLVAVSI